jgi:hypothetical protein
MSNIRVNRTGFFAGRYKASLLPYSLGERENKDAGN